MVARIIGSGIAGIAASIRLAARGYKVHVHESNNYPGGKLTAFTRNGYRFDAGPSLFTMPFLVDELFGLAGKNPKDFFNYTKLNVACHYFWEDGVNLRSYTNANAFANEVEEKLGVDKQILLNHLNDSAMLYEYTVDLFMKKSLHKASTYLSKATLKALSKVYRFHLFDTMHGVNQKALQEPHLVQLFDRYATYNGSNPYKAPGVLNIIPHLEHNQGAFFPHGGMHSITLTLVELAKSMGVEFHFNQRVEEIEIQNQKAVGIRVNKQLLAADVVVSNMDVVPTYRHLLKKQKAPEKVLKQERSSSALIFYWGIKKEFPDLDVHNIFFAENYKAEFEALFDEKTLFDDPTVYVHISSKVELNDAPKGCENWFVMINVPGNTGQNWDEWIAKARKSILAKLSRLLNEDIEALIACEDILDPRLIEQRTSSHTGALYGASSNNRYAAFLRHPNFAQHIKALYFCGGSVHPGGGIPLCLLSAQIVSDLLPS